jgi:cytochrome P450 family 110
MRRISDERIDAWRAGATFRLHPEMQRITLEVILHTVFGLDEGAGQDRIHDLVLEMLSYADKPGLLLLIDERGDIRARKLQERLGRASPWGRFHDVLQRLDAALLDEIRQRRNAHDAARVDVLSMLIAARDEDGSALRDEELVAEMKTLLLAGHETTATSLTWAVSHLIQHPDVFGRLRQALSHGDTEYLDAVIKETLRLTPIIPMVGRYLTAPLVAGGHEYPAGVVLVPHIYLTHRRADLWPDPERFDPDRFLGRKVSPYEFFPFGGGTRRCIGMAFAQYEMAIVLKQIVLRTRLEFAAGYRPRLVRRGITFALSGGLPVVRQAAS